MYKSLDEAQAAKADLIDRIQSIDAQLTYRASKAVGRLPDDEYQQYLDWKAKAMSAKRTLLRKLRETKGFIAAQTKSPGNRNKAKELLKDLKVVVDTFVEDGVEVEQQEQLVLDEVSMFLSKEI